MKHLFRITLSIITFVFVWSCSESSGELFNRVGRQYMTGRWIVDNIDPLTAENLSMLDICLVVHTNLSFNAYQPLYKDAAFNTEGSWGFFTDADSKGAVNDSIVTFKSYDAKSYSFQIIERNLSDSSMLAYHLKRELLISITQPSKFPNPTDIRPKRIETAFSNIIAGKWEVLYYYKQEDPQKTPIYHPYSGNLYEFGDDGTFRLNKTHDGKYTFVYDHPIKQATLNLSFLSEQYPSSFGFVSIAINATASRKPEFILRFQQEGQWFEMLLVREESKDI